MSIPPEFERVLHRLDADVKQGDVELARMDMLSIRVCLRRDGAGADTLALIRAELSHTLDAVQQAEARAANQPETTELAA